MVEWLHGNVSTQRKVLRNSSTWGHHFQKGVGEKSGGRVGLSRRWCSIKQHGWIQCKGLKSSYRVTKREQIGNFSMVVLVFKVVLAPWSIAGFDGQVSIYQSTFLSWVTQWRCIFQNCRSTVILNNPKGATMPGSFLLKNLTRSFSPFLDTEGNISIGGPGQWSAVGVPWCLLYWPAKIWVSWVLWVLQAIAGHIVIEFHSLKTLTSRVW